MFKQTWIHFSLPQDQRGRGSDALATLLNIVLSHLKVAKTFEQLIFICFQLHSTSHFSKMATALSQYTVAPGPICWLMDFLTIRCVKVSGVL